MLQVVPKESPAVKIHPVLANANKRSNLWTGRGPIWIRSMLNCSPKVVAVGPPIVGGLRSLYPLKLGHGPHPGRVCEFTCGIREGKGEIDFVGMASVYHAVMKGAKTVEVWTNGVEMGGVAKKIRSMVGDKVEAIMTPLDTVDPSMAYDSQAFDWDETSEGGAAKRRNFEDLSGAKRVVLTNGDQKLFPHEPLGEDILPVSTGGAMISPVAIEIMVAAVERGVKELLVMGIDVEGGKVVKAGDVLESAVEKWGEAEVAKGMDVSTIREGRMDVGGIVRMIRGQAKCTLPGMGKLQELVGERGVEVIGASFSILTGKVRGVE